MKGKTPLGNRKENIQTKIEENGKNIQQKLT